MKPPSDCLIDAAQTRFVVAGDDELEGGLIIEKILAHREKPIPSLGGEVPEPVQAVFEKMVAKEAADRY